MPRRASSGRVKMKPKRVQNKNRAIIKLDTRLARAEAKLSSGMTYPFKMEYQGPLAPLDSGWNRRILIAPDEIYSTSENTKAWKPMWSTNSVPTTLLQTAKCRIKGIQLIKHYQLADIPGEYDQTSNLPVVLHSYTVSMKQDAGSIWKQLSGGQYGAGYLVQDVHWAMLGQNTQTNRVRQSQLFFLNKKCFNIHSEHHFTLGPYGVQHQGNPVVTAAYPAFGFNKLSQYQRTFKEWIPMNKTLRTAGSALNKGTDRGWTGLNYQDIPVTDQLFTITWASQGDAGPTNELTVNEYVSGIIHGIC